MCTNLVPLPESALGHESTLTYLMPARLLNRRGRNLLDNLLGDGPSEDVVTLFSKHHAISGDLYNATVEQRITFMQHIRPF